MGKSKKELKKQLKSPLLEGDQYTSPALGPGDPRHRRGPQRAGVTGLRYEPTQFEVDKHGRLRLRKGAVTQTILNKHNDSGGGSVVIPAQTRVQRCEWRRRVASSEQNHDLSTPGGGPRTDPMGLVPFLNDTTTDGVSFNSPIPPDGDTSVDWTLKFTSVPTTDGFGGNITVDIDVYVAEAGEDFAGTGGVTAPDDTLQVVVANGDPRGELNALASVTFPASTLLGASSLEVYMIFKATTIATPGSAIGIAGVWLEYQTEAATITVT